MAPSDLGTIGLIGAASAASAQPPIKPLSELKKETEVAAVYHVDYGDPPRFVQILTNISNHYSARGADPFALQMDTSGKSGTNDINR